MDACTSHRVNYFAINVRFIDENNTIVTKTLAVKDTMAHHTGEYLRSWFKRYNASNMLKITENMNQDNENALENIDEIFTSDTQIEPIIEKEEYLDDICAVHMLQLAIRDRLKDSRVAKIITKLRQVATVARTPKIDAILRRRARKRIILDQSIRWGSTYLMVKQLLELKTFLENLDNPSVSLTENQ
ncbi:uncharacterized protein [Centruroides vittatus]|uniref:uncharacterized protein n=1 Tax=Centruroides vittatus TaxID=120091 RepID=UPI0035104F34